MATKLDKILIRDTGLTREGREVIVMMMPSEDGGTMAFKEKGKHGQGETISMKKVMDMAMGLPVFSEAKATVEVKKAGKKIDPDDFTGDIDLVDMARLEARLMIAGDEVMTDDVQGKLFAIIREIREDVREEAGLPPLVNGTKSHQAKKQEESKRDE